VILPKLYIDGLVCSYYKKVRNCKNKTKKSYKRVPLLLPASIYLIMNQIKLKENKKFIVELSKEQIDEQRDSN